MNSKRKAMGDWQTPQEFADKCCQIIKNEFCFTPSLIIEPTCGIGNFIEASRHYFSDSTVLGIELNPVYSEKCLSRFENDVKVIVRQGDFLHDNVIGPPFIKNNTLVRKSSVGHQLGSVSNAQLQYST